jgi:hypothetical protein
LVCYPKPRISRRPIDNPQTTVPDQIHVRPVVLMSVRGCRRQTIVASIRDVTGTGMGFSAAAAPILSRVRELRPARLRVNDIDSPRMTIALRQFKGQKDRMGHVVSCFARDPAAVLATQQPKQWLFPGEKDHPDRERKPLVRAAFLLTDRTQFPAPRSFPAHPDLKHTSNASTVLFLVFRVF